MARVGLQRHKKKLESEGWIISNHRSFYILKYTQMTSIVTGFTVSLLFGHFLYLHFSKPSMSVGYL
jgi:hypothetical protein